VTDQDLVRVITTGIPGTGMQAFRFDASEIAGSCVPPQHELVRSRSVKAGDAGRGRTVVETKGGCGSCHRRRRAGSRVAPDSDDVGATRSAGSLLRSLIDPTSQMMPINRPVRAVTRDGKVINGPVERGHLHGAAAR